jgi:formylglycine-generating enzyme required for sulfatase activity
MSTWRRARILACVAALAGAAHAAPREPKAPGGMVVVGPGVYRPLYPASAEEQVISVRRFYLDAWPVTNGEFLAFVTAHPEWRRNRVGRLFADAGYLSQWSSADALGAAVRPRSPVTNVSWFAAKAYCAARAGRLPSEREWELAALASETARDGSRDPGFVERILDFYATPAVAPSLRDVGRGKPNVYGVYDLHGLVWEWLYDFSASLVATDSREKGDAERNRFCGTSGASAQAPSDYAAFMRVAFRSSLEAAYTTSRLGFRCAADVEEAP